MNADTIKIMELRTKVVNLTVQMAVRVRHGEDIRDQQIVQGKLLLELDRFSNVCPACGEIKSQELIVCRYCFEYRTDKIPFKVFQGSDSNDP